ncbi:MAG: class I SAM-dependent methyltransferase [Rhizomicrobium sp.]
MLKADKAFAVAKGIATCIPGAYALLGAKRTKATEPPPEYSYGVWFKHLALLNEATGCGIPQAVVELGPGDSIGVGIAALLSGAHSYVGVDDRPYAARANNSAMASELMSLFKAKAPFVPSGMPDFRHLLDQTCFPSHLLTHERLSASLRQERLGEIHDSVRRAFNRANGGMISYRAPISDPSVVRPMSADLVLSHSVLEHVADLAGIIRSTYSWLRRGGFCSHQFDLRSHDIVRAWDGHRAFGGAMWRAVVGGRRFLINRLPYSSVIRCVEDAGFSILRADRICRAPTLSRRDLCKEWRVASDDDLQTEGGYIIAQRPA